MSDEELKLLKKEWKKQENLKPTTFYSEDYVKELQERIDKAIKKLNKYRNRKDTWGLWCMEYGDNAEVIKILGGEVRND